MPLLRRDDAPILARGWYREDGSASALTRSLASAPDLLETLMPFLAQVMGEGALDLATKELVIVRVSQLNGCRYCLAAHRPIALAAGVPRPAPGCRLRARSSRRAAAARASRRGLDRPGDGDAAGVTDELVAATLDHVREDQLIELTVLAGTITMLNQYCTALDIPPPV